ncbi:MAG: hypothetical protein KBE09_02070 [Candidatus Pacebacteria bacterium]|nr:hypothetical protein [Candidatus Paceibacterota bacterium]
MAALTAVFSVTLLGITGLFGLRMWEVKRGARLLETTRAHADDLARYLKYLLQRFGAQMRRFPSLMLLITRYFIHLGAKAFARFARKMEEGAHQIADRMSHKHRFQRRESQNQFLKDVAEHKNGLGGKVVDSV